MEARLADSVEETTRAASQVADNFKQMAQRASETARDRARYMDRAVRENPYMTAGIAIGVGLLVGALIRSWWLARA